MFIYTAKLSKKYLVAAIVALIAVVAAVVIAVGNFGQSAEAAASFTGSAKTNDDRVKLLSSLGWEVEPEPVDTATVVIPAQLNGAYENYNALQKKQGCDLSKYAEKTATRYTYKITNYPTGDDTVVADLIVYRGKVIAGDVQSVALNGFMHGLEYPVKR